MDGSYRRANGEIIAAFRRPGPNEAYRLSCCVVTYDGGRETQLRQYPATMITLFIPVADQLAASVLHGARAMGRAG